MPFLLLCGDAPISYCSIGSNIEEAALQRKEEQLLDKQADFSGVVDDASLALA